MPVAAERPLPGAILTGGASRRMGRTKALIDVDGVAMGRRVADALLAAGCDTVIGFGGDPDELEPLGLTILPDRHPGTGPLGGVLGVLDTLDDDAPLVAVVACDLPALTAAVLRNLIAVAREHPDVDVVVARTTAVEPMCAIWNRSATDALRQRFDDGERALHTAIGGLRHIEVAVDPTVLRNINTPDELDRYP
jgi:molybdopterin-guanine dinucleotide biosynthesis protein A